MRVLFLTIGDISNIYNRDIYPDLLRKFKDEGHDVYVVCARERRAKLNTELCEEYGIRILRVKVGNITETSLIEKGISTILIEQQFIYVLKKYLGNIKFDLVMYSTPPITFGKVIEYVKKRDGAKSYLLLKDIFPQNAVDLGMFSKNSVIYKYFKHKEKKLYSLSDYIGCMSQANVDYVLKHNPNVYKDKIEVCPNSIEIQDFYIKNNDKQQIREKYGIPHDKIIFVYGGNLGKPQGIDFLVKCLKSQNKNEKVFFTIVGAGTEYSKIERYITNDKPINVKLIPKLSSDDYNLLVASCDVGMIFLDQRFTIPNFPSRLLSYMQASIPVLAVTDSNTDMRKVIAEGEFGWWCEAGNITEFIRNVDLIADKANLLKSFGENSYKYLINNYSIDLCYDIVIKHFKRTEKILILSHCFYPSKNRGGPTISVTNLTKSISNDFDVSVITTFYEKGTRKPYIDVTLGKNRVFNCDVYYLDNDNCKALLDLIKRIRPSVLYVSSIFSAEHSIPAMLYKKLIDKKVRLIIAPRGELMHSALNIKSTKKRLFLNAIKISSLIKDAEFHVTSEEEQKELGGIFPNSIAYFIKNLSLVETKNFTRPLKDIGVIKILSIGRIHPIKNIDKAIEIFNNINGVVQFDIYGPKEDLGYFDVCMNIIAGLKNNVIVEYKGSVEHDKIPELFSHYHLFLSPTQNENFGHSIVEAMLNGCPVIISDKTPWQNLDYYCAGYSIALDHMEEFLKAVQRFIDMNNTEYIQWCFSTEKYIKNALNVQKNIDEYKKMFGG